MFKSVLNVAVYTIHMNVYALSLPLSEVDELLWVLFDISF